METPASVLDEAQQLDTWNQPREDEALEAFVLKKLSGAALQDITL